MKGVRRSWHRFLGLWGRRRLERDLTDEFAAHIEMQTEDNIRAGMSPADACRAAVMKFGAMESIKERYRDQRGLPRLETVLMDLR